MNKLITSLLLLFFFQLSFAQNGVVKGKIIDKTTKETIPGAKVTIDQTAFAAMTNFDGVFTFKDVPYGSYKINVKYPQYQNPDNIQFKLYSADTMRIEIELEKAVKEIGGVTVKGKSNKESTGTLLTLQRKSATVLDGISQEAMKKTPDSKASDVLKRVSGASVQDNKFVVIRGLSDRYNFALINGAPLPSTESDKKAFSFDIFPSNMLDNLMIIKTATPDLPGEFAGGVIQINTSEPKDKNFQSIQIGGAYNAITTFKNYRTYNGSSLDFLGLGSSDRQIPTSLPTTATFASLTSAEKANLAKGVNFSWSTNDKMALPNSSIQYSLGRSYKKDEKEFGFVLAYSYQNNLQTNNITRREFEEQSTGVILKMELNDDVYTQTVLNSGMFNATFKLNKKNKFSFKNMYSINSEDRVNIRKGVRELDNDPHFFEKSTNIWYTQNNLFTSQLAGEHDIKKGKLNWNIGFSDVQRNVPNLRRIVYRKLALTEDDPNEQYVAVIQNNGTIPTAAGNMFWSTNNEKIASFKYDYVLPFKFKETENEFKIGGFHQYRTRDFVARNFGYSQYKPTGSSFNSEILLLPEDQLFSSENLGLMSNGQGGFKLEEASKVNDSYQANSLLNAGFLMLDTKPLEKLRLVGGVRLESYNQQFSYIEFGSNKQINIDTTVVDILPSINIIYNLHKKMNLRLAYYKTVSRPEFRELAPFAFYNFVLDNVLSGNDKLKRALINNYDVRFEYFFKENQMVSVSGFYKDFTDPIELINRTGTSGAPELYYSNVSKVVNYGVELEYRVNLDFMSKNKEHKFWSRTALYTNLSLIKSKVNLDGFFGSGVERPLQGQSPYIVNAGLNYNSLKNDWSVNLSYNIVGQRIYIVGNEQEPSVWENGRNVIDFQLSKKIKQFDIRFSVKDILAQKLIYFQDLNNNQKYDDGTDNKWQESTFGSTVSLSVKYNFK
jgi:TonB-dependent receptor